MTAAAQSQPPAPAVRFSVLIPVYDVRPFIDDCLGSVLAQTYGAWECLCVDDGSRDGSGARLDDYARKDPRIRVTHQRNGGVSRARNRALSRARGDWLAFLDGDDTLHPRFLQWVWKSVLEGGEAVDAVRFQVTLGADEGAAVFRPCETPPEQRLVHFRSATAHEQYAIYGELWRLCLRREAVAPFRFDTRLAYAEDLLFVLQALTRVRDVVVQAWRPYGYRLRQGSAMQRAITPQRLSGSAWFALRATEALEGSPLAGNRPLVKNLYNGAVEWFAAMAIRWRSERGLWEPWWDALGELRGRKVSFSPWQRMVLSICAKTRSLWSVSVFCVWPYRLKTRVNRRKIRGWARKLGGGR